MNHRISIQNQNSLSSSTLLIPEYLYEFFSMQAKRFKTTENLFAFIVNSNHPVYRQKPRPGTGKIKYQPNGMNLQRVDFLPSSGIWEKFRVYSYAQRVSMTLLFVMLLMEWDKFEANEFVVPKIPEVIQLKLSLTIHKTFSLIELDHLNL